MSRVIVTVVRNRVSSRQSHYRGVQTYSLYPLGTGDWLLCSHLQWLQKVQMIAVPFQHSCVTFYFSYFIFSSCLYGIVSVSFGDWSTVVSCCVRVSDSLEHAADASICCFSGCCPSEAWESSSLKCHLVFIIIYRLLLRWTINFGSSIQNPYRIFSLTIMT